MRLKPTGVNGITSGREHRLGKKRKLMPHKPHKEPEAHGGLQLPSRDPQSHREDQFQNIQLSLSNQRLQLARDCLSKVFCKIWHIWTLSDLHFCLWLKADSAQLSFWQLCSSRAVFAQFLEVLPTWWPFAWQAISPCSSFLLVWDPQTHNVAFYPN